MDKADVRHDAPLIGEFDDSLLTEVRLVVAVVFTLALLLLVGWADLA